MLADKYYAMSCKTAYDLSREKEYHGKAIQRAIPAVLDAYASNKDYRAILRNAVLTVDFPFPWQKEKALEQDIFRFKRFFNWLDGATILERNHKVQIDTDFTFPDGSKTLETIIPLIVQWKGGSISAVLLHNKVADKSLKGKSVHTAITTDVGCIAAKLALEKKYPHVNVNVVYLKNSNDTDTEMLPDFFISDTKQSNVLTVTYSSFYEEDGFNYGAFSTMLKEVLNTPLKKDCYNCSYGSFCKVDTIRRTDEKQVQKASYQLPKYNDEQQMVLSHVDGPMLVCAGPGSGKTATLIGRVKYLIEKGIAPQSILLITFTNEAAKELKVRCESFCTEGRMPKICTLNSLGYDILLNNLERIPGGVQLLTDVEKFSILKNLVSVFPPLMGFQYEQPYGKNGLFRTLDRRLMDFSSMSIEQFFQKNRKLGTDFVPFAEQYQEILRSRGFITFDQQISLANDLFREYPEILSLYQQQYRYTMVDEVQDVNEDQWLFVTSIARNNIVIVGDDDQALYGFRGASSRYMLEFQKYYQNAKVVVLHKNYRSDSALIECANRVIGRNQKRIKKEIVGVRNRGVVPKVMNGASASDFDGIITSLRKEGYRYGDIAILSTKNAPLEDLHRDMSTPTVLAKGFLREHPLFLLLYSILRLYKDGGPMEEAGFKQFLRVCGVTDPVSYKDAKFRYADPKTDADYYQDSKEDTLYMAMRLLAQGFFCLSGHPSPVSFCKVIAYEFGLEHASVMESMEQLISDRYLRDTEALYQYMNYMVQFEDDTRVLEERGDRVTLITCHESKGREYPVVLLRDDYGDPTEETRRVFYVALTRAKERVYVLSEQESIFAKELSA